MFEHSSNFSYARYYSAEERSARFYHRMADSYLIEGKYEEAAQFYVESLLVGEEEYPYAGWGYKELQGKNY